MNYIHLMDNSAKESAYKDQPDLQPKLTPQILLICHDIWEVINRVCLITSKKTDRGRVLFPLLNPIRFCSSSISQSLRDR